jgi:hypothetical protein
MMHSRVRRLTKALLSVALIGASMLPLTVLAQGQQRTAVYANTNSEVAPSATPEPPEGRRVLCGDAPSQNCRIRNRTTDR